MIGVRLPDRAADEPALRVVFAYRRRGCTWARRSRWSAWWRWRYSVSVSKSG
ncbi:MAG: hypothetical protein U0521_05070 [Anaerolineae bacterium]